MSVRLDGLKPSSLTSRQWPWVPGGAIDPKSKRDLQMLLQPEMTVRNFQVLALSKNVAADTASALAGFQFTRALDYL